MSWARLMRFVLSLGAVTLIVLAAVTLLPQDKYLRYQALNDGVAPTASWIYERINRDPTPIDVAFIGTSRTGFSIHSGRMEDDLAAMGIDVSVANLHIVKTGRNMQFVITKELLTHRKVKLLVVEMDDEEDRSPHPDFIYLADSSDVLGAPLFINFRYFSDLARLPGRQFGLFLDTQLQRHAWIEPPFSPPSYAGSHLDHAEYVRTLDGVKHYRSTSYSNDEIERLRKIHDGGITPPVLPPSFDWLEYRASRYYINQILELAAHKGTKVVFLYLPRFGAPQTCPNYARLYGERVPLINPWGVMQDFRLWDDAIHTNWQGAKLVTDYVAKQIAASKLLGGTEDGSVKENQ
jgi:hypothetical protein